jgi:hypothetical protein
MMEKLNKHIVRDSMFQSHSSRITLMGPRYELELQRTNSDGLQHDKGIKIGCFKF